MADEAKWSTLRSALSPGEIQARLRKAIAGERQWLLRRRRARFVGTVGERRFTLRAAKGLRAFLVTGQIQATEQGTRIQLSVEPGETGTYLGAVGVALLLLAHDGWVLWENWRGSPWTAPEVVETALTVAGMTLTQIAAPKVTQRDEDRIVERLRALLDAAVEAT